MGKRTWGKKKKVKKLNALCPRSEEITTGKIQHPDQMLWHLKNGQENKVMP